MKARHARRSTAPSKAEVPATGADWLWGLVVVFGGLLLTLAYADAEESPWPLIIGWWFVSTGLQAVESRRTRG